LTHRARKRNDHRRVGAQAWPSQPFGFDLLTEVLGLDRRRATGWTLGRVLQNALWDIEDGDTALDPAQIAIAAALTRRTRYL
jgi:hypothetical protein